MTFYYTTPKIHN